MSESYLPAARSSKLVVRELGEEVLVYDAGAHRAHCLNRAAALVWEQCDGETPVPVIAARVGERLSATIPEEVVWLALEGLAGAGLLSGGAARRASVRRVSRRSMLRRLGLAAAALPLITSIVSPTPAQAESPCTETSCPPGTFCNGGVCEPVEDA